MGEAFELLFLISEVFPFVKELLNVRARAGRSARRPSSRDFDLALSKSDIRLDAWVGDMG
jgi:hypothetical protein